MQRPQFPGPLGVTLAVMISVHPTEKEPLHQVKVVVQGEDGASIAEATTAFQIGAGDLLPGEEYSVPLVLPLAMVGLPAAGGYSLEILIDGTHQATLPFRAILVAGQLPPPPAIGGYL
jgi:hypothetical protein